MQKNGTSQALTAYTRLYTIIQGRAGEGLSSEEHLLFRDLSSVPSTYSGQLTTASSSREFDAFFWLLWVSTHSHRHTHSEIKINMNLTKKKLSKHEKPVVKSKIIP